MAFCKLILLFTGCFAGPPGTTRFEWTEAEINGNIDSSLKSSPRPGLDSLVLKFFDGNYVSTYATVDFDAVEKWKPGTIPKLMRRILNGKRSILVDLRFFVNNAHATFKIEKAYYEGIPIPPLIVEKVIQAIAARQPEKYDSSSPLPLPLGMVNMWTKPQLVVGEK